jgi:hypothetical protein
MSQPSTPSKRKSAPKRATTSTRPNTAARMRSSLINSADCLRSLLARSCLRKSPTRLSHCLCEVSSDQERWNEWRHLWGGYGSDEGRMGTVMRWHE